MYFLWITWAAQQQKFPVCQVSDKGQICGLTPHAYCQVWRRSCDAVGLVLFQSQWESCWSTWHNWRLEIYNEIKVFQCKIMPLQKRNIYLTSCNTVIVGIFFYKESQYLWKVRQTFAAVMEYINKPSWFHDEKQDKGNKSFAKSSISKLH